MLYRLTPIKGDRLSPCMEELQESVCMHWLREGQVEFQVGHAFYRRSSALSRDLGVLAAVIDRQNQGRLRVLDAMSGCGVRSQRYAIEGQADWVWANDANPEGAEILRQNLAHQLRPEQYRMTHWPAKRVFAECYLRQDFYDLLDLDAFGVPSSLVASCLQATKIGGLIYLTSTDSRTLAGHNLTQSIWHYGGCLRSHPAAQEQGLRVLIGLLLQQATQQGFSIQPVFSFFQGQVYRVMVRLHRTQSHATHTYGFLGYCHACGHYQTADWQGLSRAVCPHHQPPKPLTLSGPLWLAALHDHAYLGHMIDMAQAWGWQHQVKLLQVMQAEAALPPYYYRLGEIGKQGQMDIPKRDRLIEALQAQGYQACPTHIEPQAVKTTAAFRDCVAIAKNITALE